MTNATMKPDYMNPTAQRMMDLTIWELLEMETDDAGRLNNGEMSEAEINERIEAWRQIGEMWIERGRLFKGMSRYIRDEHIKEQKRKARLAKLPQATILEFPR